MEAWESGLDRDWSVPAGTLEWSCFTTADHTVDCVFSYALFLASRRQDTYPNFTELHALPGASPADLLYGLRAVCTMLTGRRHDRGARCARRHLDAKRRPNGTRGRLRRPRRARADPARARRLFRPRCAVRPAARPVPTTLGPHARMADGPAARLDGRPLVGPARTIGSGPGVVITDRRGAAWVTNAMQVQHHAPVGSWPSNQKAERAPCGALSVSQGRMASPPERTVDGQAFSLGYLARFPRPARPPQLLPGRRVRRCGPRVNGILPVKTA